MARRSGRWSDLSPRYRDRLRAAGIDARAWKRGDSLKAARGHGGNYPSPAERCAILHRLDHGGFTNDDRLALLRWAQSRSFPAWMRSAGLSPELGLRYWDAGVPSPAQWSDVDYWPAFGNWTMELTMDDGTSRVLGLPPEVTDESLASTTDILFRYDLAAIDVHGTPDPRPIPTPTRC